ncbi:hypothetical protein ACRRTK_007815 [Alexandromys fortis]
MYKIGQLYMISKHSHEQSDRGEGVEVVQNEPFEDPHHGNGQFTEKRVYLNRSISDTPTGQLRLLPGLPRISPQPPRSGEKGAEERIGTPGKEDSIFRPLFQS